MLLQIQADVVSLEQVLLMTTLYVAQALNCIDNSMNKRCVPALEDSYHTTGNANGLGFESLLQLAAGACCTPRQLQKQRTGPMHVFARIQTTYAFAADSSQSLV